MKRIYTVLMLILCFWPIGYLLGEVLMYMFIGNTSLWSSFEDDRKVLFIIWPMVGLVVFISPPL